MTKITEEWARTAPAGPKLDRVCAEWMGLLPIIMRSKDAGWVVPSTEEIIALPRFSTDWSAAGPLLEAISPPWSLSPDEDGGFIMLPYRMDVLNIVGGNRYTWPRSGCPCLAIARGCAVLDARGVSREDLRRAA